MAGYIILDVKTRKTITISAGVAILVFVIGILIGYFSGKAAASARGDSPPTSASSPASGQTVCSSETVASPNVSQFVRRYVERHSTKHACLVTAADCLDFDLPRNYIAYHLKGKSIKIDGKLDDSAWTEVPWSEDFVDIRSAVFPKPYLDTKFKLRWDDDRIYIGAYIQETNLWATYDTHDDKLHHENNFEVFFDVDGSMFNYKQIQVNVLGTLMDQILYKSPHDALNRTANSVKAWHGEVEHAVYTDGTVNKPGDADKYWSVEMAVTFKALAASSNRVQEKPFDNEVWFTQFGRAEFKLNAVNGRYVNPRPAIVDWWSWQPCDAINLQLQDRWGLVQFKKSFSDKKFNFPRWHIYKALFETFTAMKKYEGVNSKLALNVEELDLPPYLFSGTCVDVPEIVIWGSREYFSITVKSKLISHKPAHIRHDRYVTFSDRNY